jgi:uncharacterized repeat protein (TIGR03809 family)
LLPLSAIGGPFVPVRQFPRAMDQAALKWRDLAERRRAHFIDLYQTGRWRHYYTDEQFLASMQEAINIANRWAQIAPRPGEAPRQMAAE